MSNHHHKHQDWSRDGFIISTDPSLVSIPSLTAAFASDMMYWTKALPYEDMKSMVQNSLCFGLYTPTPSAVAPPPSTTASILLPDSNFLRPSAPSRSTSTGPGQIGFARVITDHVTFAYLTDVYVLPEWQGQGLASWMIACVQEVLEAMPHLRRSMLVTGGGTTAADFYIKRMKMAKIEGGKLFVMSWRGPGAVV